MNAPPSSSRTCLGVLLAAGDGVRMRSAIPKALHPVAGRPMVAHALAALRDAGASAIAVVVGPDRDDVAAAARAFAPEAEVFIQSERRGTAHATLAARAAIARGYDDLLVVYADAPLVTAASLKALRQALADGADVAALAFEAANPTGYGRMIERDGRLVAIREEKDATAAERAIRRCNAGPAAIRGAQALALLELVGCDNAQKEFYLTAVAEIAAGRGLKAETRLAAEEEAMGVNDRLQLAAAEAAMQRRLRHKAMVEGATLVAPETIFLSADSVIGRDVTIEPHVVIGAGVTIGDGAWIHAFSHLEGAKVAGGAAIGPYARLRPGADIAAKAKVGNFVEIKASTIEAGAKVNHLTYIGDARVGAGTNIGAGTITCNYDGFGKYRTDIGAGVFIGSNSALVAPVKIGDGAYIGSGSVVTKDVEADALAVARGRQVAKPGWAKAFREKMKKKG
ncbi:MAG: bifunctional UDP-N-acetylglucosamine diphosphorylase/glucosamine-1-phosphate N-acetyltransferase GlmU [Roseiarcus sp.]|jgi:bifunctional UDP-N-acetylglucosamine pyrophosphorylase/glucosamine-1-phosphate N-acetyltransferase|uniref:bifunctional UDP-N-acetylglucosamine diphosphorylase/glucosamine-1-phosphate N-acetyltransferase GlmU n=1 Tax=Roseiarcus sp. TaxID=1969460 RepID=UPI003C1A4A70